MAFFGARPAEIGQLAINDVREEHGHWIMHITDDGDDDKSVKNHNSKRILPVHDELVRFGLIKYRDKMVNEARPEFFLWPRVMRKDK